MKRLILYVLRLCKRILQRFLSIVLGRPAELRLIVAPKPGHDTQADTEPAASPVDEPTTGIPCFTTAVLATEEPPAEEEPEQENVPVTAESTFSLPRLDEEVSRPEIIRAAPSGTWPQETLYKNKYYRIIRFTGNDIGISSIDDGRPIVSVFRLVMEGKVADQDHAAAELLTYLSSKEHPLWGDQEIILNFAGPLQCQVSLFCRDDSPEIKFVARCEALSQKISVLRVAVELEVAPPARELYLKNRKVLRIFENEHYWLDRQGMAFGNGPESLLIYHSPEVSSLEFETKANRLVVNLDSAADHPMLTENASGGYSDASASTLCPGDVLEAKFSCWIGYQPAAMPRLMTQPHGYVATHVWTEHGCFTHERVNRAVYFGSDEILQAADAIGGFVKAGIPVTKSVFYDNPDGFLNDEQTDVFVGPTPAIKTSESFREHLLDLHKAGYEICLHCAAPGTSDETQIREALRFMREHFQSISWIDHLWYKPDGEISGCLESFCCRGLKSYSAESWREFGIRFFWNAYYEYKYSHSTIRGSSEALSHWLWDSSRANPIYWRHPTLNKERGVWGSRSAEFISFATWESWYPGDNRRELYTEGQLRQLTDEWGVRIAHCYPTYVGANNAAWEIREDGQVTTTPAFEALLASLSKLQSEGLLWNATLRHFLEYLVSLEKIEIGPDVESGGTKVTNRGAELIKGLAFAIDTDAVTVDARSPAGAWRGNNYVFWFDLPPEASAIISAPH